jgi:hypothetical protein
MSRYARTNAAYPSTDKDGVELEADVFSDVHDDEIPIALDAEKPVTNVLGGPVSLPRRDSSPPPPPVQNGSPPQRKNSPVISSSSHSNPNMTLLKDDPVQRY